MTQGRSLRRLANVAVVGLAFACAGSVAACKKDTLTGTGEEALSPVPAPAGLVAELFIAKPGTTWTHARELVGGGAKLLPSEYPMLVATLLGLPAGAAEQIDANVPTVGAVTSDGEKELPVIAIHVRDSAKVVASMTTGPDARFLARVDAPSRVTLLEPKPGQSALSASLGVLGNYLLVGYAPDALLRVGPYAARTVPTHAMPTEDIALVSNHAGLAGPLKARLMAWWDDTKKQLGASDQQERERHGGSAPTFGDPGAAVAKADATFQGLFAIMGDLAEGRLSLALDDGGAHAKFSLKPQAATGVAANELSAMVVGSSDPLLDFPDDVTVGMVSRDSAEVRAKSASDQVEALGQILAGKLGDADKKVVSDVFDSWSKGRGDWLVAGGSLASGHRVVYAKTSIADQAVVEHGLKTLLDVPKIPALAEPLKHWLGDVKLTGPEVADGASVVVVERKVALPPSPKADPKDKKKMDTERFELGWQLDKDVGTFVGAEHARDALAAMAKAKGAGSLRSDPEIAKMVQSLGADSAFTLLILPIRTVSALSDKPAPGAPSAPIVLAFGRTAGEGWFRFDAAPAAIRELARMQGLP